eukprot:TRINITY_DN39884_c0_g1_i1.p1 TRINITY_DN39884_c0_g1~~TRINITY_DN39884_c0_g1_i1.p1  ORF type:complete len:706 (+),score=173.46 TRINITY_DN39884_c0_g1_i1:40-2157(+)
MDSPRTDGDGRSQLSTRLSVCVSTPRVVSELGRLYAEWCEANEVKSLDESSLADVEATPAATELRSRASVQDAASVAGTAVRKVSVVPPEEPPPARRAGRRARRRRHRVRSATDEPPQADCPTPPPQRSSDPPQPPPLRITDSPHQPAALARALLLPESRDASSSGSDADAHQELSPHQRVFYWAVLAACGAATFRLRGMAERVRQGREYALRRARRRTRSRQGALYLMMRQTVARAWMSMRCHVKVGFPLAAALRTRRRAAQRVRAALRVYAVATRFARSVRRFRSKLLWMQRQWRHSCLFRKSAEVTALHLLNQAECDAEAAASPARSAFSGLSAASPSTLSQAGAASPQLALTATHFFRLWSSPKPLSASVDAEPPPPVTQQHRLVSSTDLFRRKGQHCIVSRSRPVEQSACGPLLFRFKMAAVSQLRRRQKLTHHRQIIQWEQRCRGVKDSIQAEKRRRAKYHQYTARALGEKYRKPVPTGTTSSSLLLPPRPVFRLFLSAAEVQEALAEARQMQLKFADELRRAVRARFLPSILRGGSAGKLPPSADLFWWPGGPSGWWESEAGTVWGFGSGWAAKRLGPGHSLGPCSGDRLQKSTPENEQLLSVLWSQQWSNMLKEGQRAERALAQSLPQEYRMVPLGRWVARCLPQSGEERPGPPAMLRNLFLEELEQTQRIRVNRTKAKSQRGKSPRSKRRITGKRR